MSWLDQDLLEIVLSQISIDLYEARSTFESYVHRQNIRSDTGEQGEAMRLLKKAEKAVNALLKQSERK